MTEREKIALCLKHAREGLYGSPNAPKRNRSGFQTFWDVFFGHRKASEYKNTTSYPFAKAGELYREETPNTRPQA